MTSSDGKQGADAPESGKQAEGGSMLPTVLAGAGILLVAGLMIFWPDDSTQATKKQSARVVQGADADAKGGRGGIPSREADKARGASQAEPATKSRINPRLQPATEFGMSPNPPKKGPPEFENNEEEIAYWETQLAEAQRVLAMRERAIERLPEIKEQIKAGNDPEGGLKAFERREQIIHENLGKQKQKVAEIEEKLGAMKAGG
jgi:hypothetical protein